MKKNISWQYIIVFLVLAFFTTIGLGVLEQNKKKLIIQSGLNAYNKKIENANLTKKQPETISFKGTKSNLAIDEGKIYPFYCDMEDSNNSQNTVTDIKFDSKIIKRSETSIKVTRKATSTNSDDAIISLPINPELEDEDTLGVWFYISKQDVENLKSMKLSLCEESNFGVLTSDKFTYDLYKWGLVDGWNFIKLKKKDFKLYGNAEWKAIKNIFIQFNEEDKTKDLSIYFDSVVKNNKIQPTILINFDSCDKNLYNVAYPILDSYKIPATFFIGGNTDFSASWTLNKDQINELIAKGWEYGMYGGKGMDNNSLGNWSNYDEQYEALNANYQAIISNGLEKPTAYSCPNNADRPITTGILKEKLGFKIIRGAAAGFTSINYFDSDTSVASCFQITDKRTIEEMKSYVDHAIEYGECISVFTHGIKTDDSGLYCSEELFKEFIKYVGEKIQSGELKAMTYTEFYNACVK